MNVYVEGSVVRLTAAFTDPTNANAAVDPTAVTLTVGQGGPAAAAATTYTYGTGNEIVKDAIGDYHADVDTTGWSSGAWWYRWDGTGAAQAVAQGTFGVEATKP